MSTNDAVSNDVHNLRRSRHALTCDSLNSSREAVRHDEDVIVSIYGTIGVEVDGDHIPWTLAIFDTLRRASVRLVPFGAGTHMAASNEPLCTGGQTWPVELLAKALNGRSNAGVP